MKKPYDHLGIILAAVTGGALLVSMILRTFLPRIILPHPDLSAVSVLILASLLIEHYFLRDRQRDYRWLPLYGVLIFGLFPMASTLVSPLDSLLLAIDGAAMLIVLSFLFDMLVARLSDSPASRLAPVVGAFGLFLAVQCIKDIWFGSVFFGILVSVIIDWRPDKTEKTE